MLGAIPNPTKKIVIDIPFEKVKSVMPLISILNSKYKNHSSDDLLKLYSFEATEFLSLGVYIDVNLLSINDNATDVKIEIRRKLGAFDKQHEVQYANEHIKAIFDLISEALRMNEDDVKKLIQDAKEKADSPPTQNEKKLSKKIVEVILIVFAIAIFVLMFFRFFYEL